MALETTDDKLIPLLHVAPSVPSKGYIIISDPGGKKNISAGLLDEYKKQGVGIAVVDLSGTGEAASKETVRDKSMVLHTLSRSELWLGKTMLGEWVKELTIVTDFLKSKCKAQKVGLDCSKEAGLAAMFLGAAEWRKGDYFVLHDIPVSYLFDNREFVDYFSMAVHLPHFLNWGDVSLASALTGKQVSIINPVTMSGQTIDGNRLKEYQKEFETVRRLSGQAGTTLFKTSSKETISKETI